MTAVFDSQFDLTALRERYASTLSRTCTVPGLPRALTTHVGDGLGGTYDETLGPGRTGVRCSFGSGSGNNPYVSGAVIPIGTYVMRFEYGVELQSGMIIEVDASGSEPACTMILDAPLDHARMLGQQWRVKEYKRGVS